MTSRAFNTLVAAASRALKDRKEEVNRLNVFPVPDGDTGTNMSLTMDTVVAELAKLDAHADLKTRCHTVTHGSLMGARGNSGVILSQILRGLCEGAEQAEGPTAEGVAVALERSVTVAFQAVRKPVEGTILTVLRDSAEAARALADSGVSFEAALDGVSAAAFESVKRTPELLPVLKENGVVDAGGYGLALLIEGFVEAATGSVIAQPDFSAGADALTVVPVDDWDDDEYLYCTEFLLFGDGIDTTTVGAYLAQAGGSELVVGADGQYKVHVHTDDPGSVLAYATGLGEVAEVHVNNMRRQTAARDESLKSEAPAPSTPAKPLGFVAVAAGKGLGDILRSLGVDEVVSGGQTMNPSTQDLVEAVGRVHAEKVIILPNNKNIVMAANSAAAVAGKPVAVVPTTSVPESFAALFAWDGSDDLDAVCAGMTAAAAEVRTGEVTTAVKDAKSKAGDIHDGDVIGIAAHEIEVVGSDVLDVSVELAQLLAGDDADTLTLLAGEDLSDEDLATLISRLGDALPGVEVESHRGDQPLYPVILSAE